LPTKNRNLLGGARASVGRLRPPSKFAAFSSAGCRYNPYRAPVAGMGSNFRGAFQRKP